MLLFERLGLPRCPNPWLFEHEPWGKNMRRLLITSAVLLLVFLGAGTRAVLAQGDRPGPASRQSTPAAASASASKEEVEELRSEVAAQQQTIEELRTMVQRLMAQQTGASEARVINAAIVQQQPAEVDEPLDVAQKSAAKPGEFPLTSGWNGEHFFIRSPDGTFQIQPYGYVNADYRAYKGDGAPSNTFLIRRARFGFQGNYGSHFQFALLTDVAATSGSIVRDVYINAKIIPQFQIQAGQFKEPFAQETAVGATNLDFVERGLQSMLYPSASSAFRSPGVTIHGDIREGAVQYWIGAFNGKGYVTANTTSEPEIVGRLRFYPWRANKDSVLQGLAFGGSVAHSRTRGLSNETSFSATNNDASFTFFPQFVVNGPVWRYNGEFTYIKGSAAVRGEYDSLSYARNGVGTLTFGGLGFLSAPEIRAKGWNIAATYLLTGEKRPENGTPRVRHPWLGPETPGGGPHGWGAWEVGLRYSGVQANEPGITFSQFFTPGNIPTFNDHTDQITFGLSWYPNYWIRYSTEFNVDRLKQPSTIGIVPQNYFVVVQRLQFRF
jgi:phosphate-selective porin OprO and OprP